MGSTRGTELAFGPRLTTCATSARTRPISPCPTRRPAGLVPAVQRAGPRNAGVRPSAAAPRKPCSASLHRLWSTTGRTSASSRRSWPTLCRSGLARARAARRDVGCARLLLRHDLQVHLKHGGAKRAVAARRRRLLCLAVDWTRTSTALAARTCWPGNCGALTTTRRHRPYRTRCATTSPHAQLPPGGVNGYLPQTQLAISMRNLSMKMMTAWPCAAFSPSNSQKADRHHAQGYA